VFLGLSLYWSIHPSIHPSTCPSTCGSTALVDLGHFFSFLIHAQSVGLPERYISPSQGRFLNRTTQTQNKSTGILDSSGIPTHDPSIRAGENGSRLRLSGHRDRPFLIIPDEYYKYIRKENRMHLNYLLLKEQKCSCIMKVYLFISIWRVP
jgi:hypothetical protein